MDRTIAALLLGTALAAAVAPPPQQAGACAAAMADPANKWRKPEARVVLTARDAIWYGRNDQLAALLDDCLKPDARDPDGDPLLHLAADRDKPDAVRILLAHGASRTLTDARGKRAADLAGPNSRALLGPASPGKAVPAGRNQECQAKYQADAALCSDATCRMSAMRKWGTCKQTGRYW